MQKSTLLLFCLVLIYNLSFAQIWQVSEVSSMPERVANNAVASATVNGTPYVYSFGGIDSTKIYSGIHLRSYRYNVIADEWEYIGDLPDNMGKIAAGASTVGNIIYIIGGYSVFSNSAEVSSNKVHRYDIVNNVFLENAAQIPASIDDQVQCVWRDSLIYVITGWSNTGNVSFVQVYDTANDTWSQATGVPNNNIYKSFGASGEIIGDTIYYFGGAQSTGSFPIQDDLRMGVINPDNPLEITWSNTTIGSDIDGYRMAATTVENGLYWIGGSTNTYNFDGIAYSGGQGVPPANRILSFFPADDTWEADFNHELPMDLRGIGSFEDSIKYLAGGMLADQWVSDKTYRLSWKKVIINDASTTKSDKKWTISPNPAIDKVFVNGDLSGMKNINFKVFSNCGKLLQQGFLDQSTNEIPLLNYSSGIYFVQLQGVKDNIFKKVVIYK